MQFAFITPTKFPEISARGDFELVLAQHLDDPEYVRSLFGKRVFLDNGAHEGEYKGLDWLFERIELIRPELVFAPDDISYGHKSEALTEEFLRAVETQYPGGAPFKIAAVPHADNLNDYRARHHRFMKDPRIDWMGVSYLDPAKLFPRQSMCMARKTLLGILATSPERKPHHLLGISDGFEDIRYGWSTDWVVSCDSSSAFMYGVLGGRYDGMMIPGGKVETLDPSLSAISPGLTDNVTHNIDFIKNKTKW